MSLITRTERLINEEALYCANNYAPLPVVLKKGEGVYLWDVEGKRYTDMMSAYSAVSHGHCHPRLVAALHEQASTLGVVSRAYHTALLSPFLSKACAMTGMDKALPMNTGVEAVETAIKASRKWAYKRKGVTENNAEIIVCTNNFHGRTIAALAMSSEEQYRDGFGPFPNGFVKVPFGDAQALERAITPNTAAFIVEPIQGEGGIIVPPLTYLKQCSELCRLNNVLLICDEIQCGLGRTGLLLACHHSEVKPDAVLLGKALGGGILPVSLFLSSEELMSVFGPGDHGSTFGGNPIACRVGLEALNLIEEMSLSENSARQGALFINELRKVPNNIVKEIRGLGLFIGLELNKNARKASDICLALMEEGILSKDTHEKVIRFAPPLVITEKQILKSVSKIAKVLTEESQ